MPAKRRYLANFEAHSVALFASLVIGGALGSPASARAQFVTGPGTMSTQPAPASASRTPGPVMARTPSTDKRDATREQLNPSS